MNTPRLQKNRDIIWRHRHEEWPFIVWVGDPNGSATGQSYRTRWRAILAAWWASRYAQQDVWIERRLPRLKYPDTPEETVTTPPA